MEEETLDFRGLKCPLPALMARRALARLLESGDVLLENFRPGVLDRLGFGDERLRQLNPRLVHCHITGFGAT